MRNHVRHVRGERTQPTSEEGPERELTAAARFGGEHPEHHLDSPLDAGDAGDPEDAFEEESAYVVHLTCPDCGQPITVFAGGQSLPEHALCPTPWNPFGLTVCTGSGRAVEEAGPVEGAGRQPEPEGMAAVLTLPAGLDWRTQPFSHVGGPASRPIRPAVRNLAA